MRTAAHHIGQVLETTNASKRVQLTPLRRCKDETQRLRAILSTKWTSYRKERPYLVFGAVPHDVANGSSWYREEAVAPLMNPASVVVTIKNSSDVATLACWGSLRPAIARLPLRALQTVCMHATLAQSIPPHLSITLSCRNPISVTPAAALKSYRCEWCCTKAVEGLLSRQVPFAVIPHFKHRGLQMPTNHYKPIGCCPWFSMSFVSPYCCSPRGARGNQQSRHCSVFWAVASASYAT